MSRRPDGGLATGPELVPEQALLEFVRGQRWFGAKSAELTAARILDTAAVRENAPCLLETLVELRYGGGMHDVYQLVLGFTEGVAPDPAIDGVTYEAVADPFFIRELFHQLRANASLPATEGSFDFHAVAALAAEAPSFDSVRPLGLEQSNSSVVVDDELIVKVYRRLDAGVNPELELLQYFAAHGFDNVPRLAGWWSYAGAPLSASLGIVQQFVPGAVDGWSLALEEIPRHPERFLDRVGRLGTVLGEMHSVLATDSSDPVFTPEEASQESLALLTATVDEQIDAVFTALPDDEALAPIAGHGDAVRDLLRGLSTVGSVGKRIRHHGDLHLGQALWADGDWLIIDFEGEPARGLTERRLKASPLRDVAGMLRSFTYVAYVTGVDPWVEQAARERFLDAYFQAMRVSGVLPPRDTALRLIRIFELEKAVYELGYELSHRPDWVGIPVAGIVRLLEEES
jgi:trehalose synthase-fused probable maltokinase